MSLKDDIITEMGEADFLKVLAEVDENIKTETKNFNNTKKISNFCLFLGVLCLFFPPFWIGAVILLIIGLATLKLKTESKNKLELFIEYKDLISQDVENNQINFDRFVFLTNKL